METLCMNARERRRLEIFSRVQEQGLSVAKAADLLGLSLRQSRRLWQRYRREGDRGLVHGLRGRAGNAGQAALREQILGLYRKKYRTFSAAHAADMLGRQEKLQVPRTTLWRWLKREGLIVQTRRVKPHRRRRPRKACVGELVQMDGSTHRWFGPEHPQAVLFVMIDDASSRVYARFYETEDTLAAFDLFGRYARRFGLPLALYVDFDSIYMVNDEEAREKARQAGRPAPVTQFGRAMRELDVRIIGAGSPQAKGRVERVNRTFQDRLVKELALLGITTIPEANAYLEEHFLASLQELIGHVPASGVNVHRRLPQGLKLADVLCFKETRVAGEDWCVRFANRILQIHPRHRALALARKAVEVWVRPAGTLELVYQRQRLVFEELASPPAQARAARLMPPARPPWRPGPDHPWKAAQACRQRRGTSRTSDTPGP
jgi:transposase